MSFSAFNDKAHPPDDKEVKKTIKGTAKLWTSLKEAVIEQFEPVEEIWKFSGKKYGWSLQLKQRKRAIVYLTPMQNCFKASFAFGDKAVAAAQDSDLPQSLLDEINNAKKYAEGRPVRIDVRRKADVDIVIKLATIKMAN